MIRYTAVLRSVNLLTGGVPGRAFQTSRKRDAGHFRTSLESSRSARNFSAPSGSFARPRDCKTTTLLA